MISVDFPKPDSPGRTEWKHKYACRQRKKFQGQEIRFQTILTDNHKSKVEALLHSLSIYLIRQVGESNIPIEFLCPPLRGFVFFVVAFLVIFVVNRVACNNEEGED